MAISIQGLTKVFGSGEAAVKALDEVGLYVPDGSIFGIIGQSGGAKVP